MRTEAVYEHVESTRIRQEGGTQRLLHIDDEDQGM
jgi:hypothetical protein